MLKSDFNSDDFLNLLNNIPDDFDIQSINLTNNSLIFNLNYSSTSFHKDVKQHSLDELMQIIDSFDDCT